MGGGNVAIDAARVALRSGASEVTRGRTNHPTRIGLEHHAAFQILHEDREQGVAGCDILIELILKELARGRTHQERQPDVIGSVRADRADDLTITTDNLGDAVTVRLNGDERIFRESFRDMITEGDSHFAGVIGFDLSSRHLFYLLTVHRSGCP